jgi:hypothetical protein
VLARVIENWLDNVGERGGYEIPFCQALVAHGHRIVFRSTHGQLEQGKDVITIDSQRQYHAYQLKAGDLSLSAWREIRGEVEELVGLPLHHPDIPADAPFTAYLVTSGRLKDPARKTIKDWKEAWKREGRRPLELIDKDALLSLFLDTHGDILLTSPKDFERFLRLFLADAKDTLDKDDFAAFLESSLPMEEDLKRAEIRRTLASTAVLASYVLQGYQRDGNHYALTEGWMMVTAYLLAIVERFPLYLNLCRPSLDLCIAAWETAAEALTREALASPRWIAGSFISDYAAKAWRVMVLLGHMCTFALFCRLKGAPFTEEGEILDRLSKELKHAFVWGEGAGPFCYSIILFLWLHGQEELACQWSGFLAKLIADLNGRRQRGLGFLDPYVAPQEFLRMKYLNEAPFSPRETFRDRSYFLPILVEFLARRGRKQLLRSIWYDVCEVDRAEFTLDQKTDFYRWRAKTGSVDTRRWPHPQRWADLVASAEQSATSELLLTTHFLPLVMPFVTVYPHRFTCALARLVEAST